MVKIFRGQTRTLVPLKTKRGFVYFSVGKPPGTGFIFIQNTDATEAPTQTLWGEIARGVFGKVHFARGFVVVYPTYAFSFVVVGQIWISDSFWSSLWKVSGFRIIN